MGYFAIQPFSIKIFFFVTHHDEQTCVTRVPFQRNQFVLELKFPSCFFCQSKTWFCSTLPYIRLLVDAIKELLGLLISICFEHLKK